MSYGPKRTADDYIRYQREAEFFSEERDMSEGPNYTDAEALSDNTGTDDPIRKAAEEIGERVWNLVRGSYVIHMNKDVLGAYCETKETAIAAWSEIAEEVMRKHLQPGEDHGSPITMDLDTRQETGGGIPEGKPS